MGFNIGGYKEGYEGCVPTSGSKFFQFHVVFGKVWQNRILAPPGGLVPPPRGNPGSPTELNIRSRLWSSLRCLVLLQSVPDFSRSAVYFDTLTIADTD